MKKIAILLVLLATACAENNHKKSLTAADVTINSLAVASVMGDTLTVDNTGWLSRDIKEARIENLNPLALKAMQDHLNKTSYAGKYTVLALDDQAMSEALKYKGWLPLSHDFSQIAPILSQKARDVGADKVLVVFVAGGDERNPGGGFSLRQKIGGPVCIFSDYALGLLDVATNQLVTTYTSHDVAGDGHACLDKTAFGGDLQPLDKYSTDQQAAFKNIIYSSVEKGLPILLNKMQLK